MEFFDNLHAQWASFFLGLPPDIYAIGALLLSGLFYALDWPFPWRKEQELFAPIASFCAGAVIYAEAIRLLMSAHANYLVPVLAAGMCATICFLHGYKLLVLRRTLQKVLVTA